MDNYIASIDVGTTNIKFNLFDSTASVVDTLTYAHQNIYKDKIIFELDIDEIWNHLIKGLNGLIVQHSIKKLEIILTTAMHSVQLMESDFSLSGHLITWADKRGNESINKMDQETLKKQYQKTGTPNHSMNPFFKLLDLKESISKEMLIGSLKDVLFYRLTGEWVIDVSNASSSGLYSLENSTWDKKSLMMIGIEERQLPIIKDINYKQRIKESLFEIEVEVYLGTSDGISSNSVFKELDNHAVLSVGTSHAVRVITKTIQLNPGYQNFNYVIDSNKYLVGLASNNGANILSWAIEVFNTSYEELEEIAANRPNIEIIFIPFLNGERAPIWNEHASGDLLNLNQLTTRESILFSIILGMTFNIKNNVENLEFKLEYKMIKPNKNNFYNQIYQKYLKKIKDSTK